MSLGGHTAEPGLADLVSAALHQTTSRGLGLTMLRKDLQFARISPGESSGLVDAALLDGRRWAGEIRRRWGRDLDAIAQRCAVPVEESDADAGSANRLVFAEYITRRPRIVLYRRAIEGLNRRLRDPDVGALLGIADARAVYLAHELFHHLDCTGEAGPISQRHRVELVRLGPWRWTSGLVSLSEIAAGAFAQALLGLRFHPGLLDVLAVFEMGAAHAVRLVESLHGCSSPAQVPAAPAAADVP